MFHHGAVVFPERVCHLAREEVVIGGIDYLLPGPPHKLCKRGIAPHVYAHEVLDKDDIGDGIEEALKQRRFVGEFFLGFFAVRDINEYFQQFFLPVKNHRLHGLQYRRAAAVGADHHPVRVIHCLMEVRNRACSLLRRAQVFMAPMPGELFGGSTEKHRCRRVHPLDHVGPRVDDNDACRHIIDECSLELFALLELGGPELYLQLEV